MTPQQEQTKQWLIDRAKQRLFLDNRRKFLRELYYAFKFDIAFVTKKRPNLYRLKQHTRKIEAQLDANS